MRGRSVSGTIFDSINHLFMLLILLVMMIPFVYVISYSLSTPSMLKGGIVLFPVGFTFDSYRKAFADPAVLKGVYISVARTTIGPAVMLLFTSMAAYVLTRAELAGVRFFRKFFVFTLYFSSGMIPMYLLMGYLNLKGTFLIYILPTAISVFNMVLIKTYIEGLPKELEEAAVVDGANNFQLFFKVIFPLCMPVFAAVVLFDCVNQWNAFIDTQIYNTMSPNLYPLQYVLYNTLNQINSLDQLREQGQTQMTAITPQTFKMAITVITVLPIACVYPFLQRFFIKGLLVGSIKG
ncbi:carbohydrate ABC transporter permease [Paenibacillus eucommiae]|uniref:Aldouronate transport system permease protein n=1 Tax=Paenibacillus eucommiae TaxID=1355755 RepID=A0ABS4IMM6_9BACL|nr:carbohydrate ABC transporter permease [Paenibacillus eucommiae]MBP1988817.1 putative aldouronate transport system permease protein [Paenibacillus eucommiae]